VRWSFWGGETDHPRTPDLHSTTEEKFESVKVSVFGYYFICAVAGLNYTGSFLWSKDLRTADCLNRKMRPS
jgi:hypothetical protein